jgi:hypothetical protein
VKTPFIIACGAIILAVGIPIMCFVGCYHFIAIICHGTYYWLREVGKKSYMLCGDIKKGSISFCRKIKKRIFSNVSWMATSKYKTIEEKAY